MEIKNDISLATAIAVAATSIGTSFQVGFFGTVGIQFISYISLADWLFAGVFLYLFFVGIGQIGFFVWRALVPIAHNGGARQRSFFITSFIIGLCGSSYLVSLMFFTPYSGWVALIASIVMLLTTVVSATFNITEAKISDYASRGAVPFWEPVAALGMVNCSVIMFGVAVASISFRPCSLVYTDGNSEAVEYLRFVGEGHLIRSKNKVRIITKDKVQEVACYSLHR